MRIKDSRAFHVHHELTTKPQPKHKHSRSIAQLQTNTAPKSHEITLNSSVALAQIFLGKSVAALTFSHSPTPPQTPHTSNVCTLDVRPSRRSPAVSTIRSRRSHRSPRPRPAKTTGVQTRAPSHRGCGRIRTHSYARTNKRARTAHRSQSV